MKTTRRFVRSAGLDVVFLIIGILSIIVIVIAGARMNNAHRCIGQCEHHTPSGKLCQDRCFKSGHCPASE